MRRYDKTARRVLRELAALAHERELSAQLAKLRERFDAWRRGELDAFELNHAVHVFHNGVSREVWKRYNPPMIDLAVACAVARGIIRREEVPDKVLEAIAPMIEQCEEAWGDDDAEAEDT